MTDSQPQPPHYLQHTWSSPTMPPAAPPSHQTLPPAPYQHSYHLLYPGQVHYSQLYHTHQHSQHLQRPPSPFQEQSPTSSSDSGFACPRDSSQFHPSFPYFQYPSPPPTLYRNTEIPPTMPYHSFHRIHSNESSRKLYHPTATKADSTSVAASSRPCALRGPPRKPRQSGHALWVGNLPFSTDLMKLKEHFSRGATTTIESLFWIPKSKSAFVNYRTPEALSKAMNRFHNSTFEGVRVVCRVRRADLPTTAPVESRSAGDSRDGQSSGLKMSPGTEECEWSSSKSQREHELNKKPPLENNARKRFFIMKSLTTEDIELSVQNGYWMTQGHNEATLNKAFQTADDVYLIFSANKSGQYFGYARMSSPIEMPSPDSPPTRRPVQPLESPQSHEPEKVFTPSTENAPDGAIFIDAYRGTIFWEADIAGKDEESTTLSSEMDNLKVDGDATESCAKDKENNNNNNNNNNLSTPFKIEWISTRRLPFRSTRGLKNPWNGYKDVKIARDGTELETNVGIRMLELFHQTKLAILWDPHGYAASGGFQAELC